MPAALKYMDDSKLYDDNATVTEVYQHEGKIVIKLDSTIFYPQGGGQPYDQGTIVSDSSSFEVQEVRFIDGDVLHIGEFTQGEISTGDTVHLEVNQERRDLNSKLQSAGHLIDMAMRDIGMSDFEPIKGFHFPEGPNVEYLGTIEVEQREEVKQKLQKSLDKMISAGYEVKIQMSTTDELAKICYFVPPRLPENKPIRVVAVWNDEYMPCGATHVKNINELEGLTVTKIKCKKGNTKISYTI